MLTPPSGVPHGRKNALSMGATLTFSTVIDFGQAEASLPTDRRGITIKTNINHTYKPSTKSGHLQGRDPPLQPIVLRQPQDVIDPFLLAPDHQLVVGEGTVPPDHDPDLEPRFTQPPYDRFQLRHHPVGRASIRRSEPCTQQMIPTKDVQWQVVCCGPGYVAERIQHIENKQDRTRIGNIVLVVAERLFGRFSPCSRRCLPVRLL